MKSLNDSYVLNNGVKIPCVGFGTWQTPEGEVAVSSVKAAIDAGYRHIDTAAVYGNEEGVGKGIRMSGVKREELFITTKLWNDDHGYEATLKAFDRSMNKLGLDYLDLYLIHWPMPRLDHYAEAWQALVDLQRDGLLRSIGVSNFLPEHLERIIAATGVTPAVNQVELHPYFPQDELRAFHAAHGIRTESWSPLARRSELLTEQVIADVASAHGVTPTQAVLRWHTQLGSTPIPKSATPERQIENADVFGFTLTDAEVHAISGLERGRLWGGDPDTHEEM